MAFAVTDFKTQLAAGGGGARPAAAAGRDASAGQNGTVFRGLHPGSLPEGETGAPEV